MELAAELMRASANTSAARDGMNFEWKRQNFNLALRDAAKL
jgi:hypothetical protein